MVGLDGKKSSKRTTLNFMEYSRQNLIEHARNQFKVDWYRLHAAWACWKGW